MQNHAALWGKIPNLAFFHSSTKEFDTINVHQKTRQRALFGVPLESIEMARSLKADGEIVPMVVLVQVSFLNGYLLILTEKSMRNTV